VGGTGMKNMVRVANRYAELGYGVLPLAPGSKAPNARLVPRGLKEASRESQRIEAWWREGPSSGLGLVAPEEVLVLDADGEEVLWKVLEEYPELQAAPRQRTPRGGGHVFVRIPQDLVGRLSATVGGLGEGIDLRGLGRSYVAAWPTELANGSYWWEVKPKEVSELPLAPERLVVSLRGRLEERKAPTLEPIECTASDRRLRGMLRWAAERVAGAGEGTRHHTLLSMARLMGGYCHLGLEPQEVVLELARAGERAGLPAREALDTAEDGVKYGLSAPLPLLDRRLSPPR